MHRGDDHIELWRWSDGWRLVRPTTLAGHDQAFAELEAAGFSSNETFRHSLRAWLERSLSPGNVPGACSAAFLLRPVSAPAGRLELGDSELPVTVFFFTQTSDGLLRISVKPGMLPVVDREILGHVYDVLLGLKDVTSRMENAGLPSSSLALAGVAHETLLQPRSPLSPYVFEDIARVVHGSSVSSLEAGLGHHDWLVLHHGTGGTSTAIFYDRQVGLKLLEPHNARRRFAAGARYTFQISVVVPHERNRKASNGEWLLLHRDVDGVRAFASPYHARRSGRDHLPFRVDVPFWGENHEHEVLEEALRKAGIYGRSDDDVVETLRRRAIVGEPHPSFELPLLLGVAPDLLVAPFDEMPSLLEGT